LSPWASINAASASPSAAWRPWPTCSGHQFEVQLRALPARTVAYIRVLNPFGGRRVMDAADRLMAWADERGKGAGHIAGVGVGSATGAGR
jgi:hypothetical protein